MQGGNAIPEQEQKRIRPRKGWRAFLLGLVGSAALGTAFFAGTLYEQQRRPQEIRFVLDAPGEAQDGPGTIYIKKTAPADDIPDCPPDLAQRLDTLGDQADVVAIRNEITRWYESLSPSQRQRYERWEKITENQVDFLRFIAACW